MDKSAREDCYQLALILVRQIDDYLQRGYHYRTTTGQVIITLDQAMVAIQRNQFPPLHSIQMVTPQAHCHASAGPPHSVNEPGGLLTGPPNPGDGRQLRLFSGGCR